MNKSTKHIFTILGLITLIIVGLAVNPEYGFDLLKNKFYLTITVVLIFLIGFFIWLKLKKR